jgi:hypothetical protein
MSICTLYVGVVGFWVLGVWVIGVEKGGWIGWRSLKHFGGWTASPNYRMTATNRNKTSLVNAFHGYLPTLCCGCHNKLEPRRAKYPVGDHGGFALTETCVKGPTPPSCGLLWGFQLVSVCCGYRKANRKIE